MEGEPDTTVASLLSALPIRVADRQSVPGFADEVVVVLDGALGRRALVLRGDAQPILSGQRRSLSRVVGEAMTAGARLLMCPMVPTVARELGFRLEPDQYFPTPRPRAPRRGPRHGPDPGRRAGVRGTHRPSHVALVLSCGCE